LDVLNRKKAFIETKTTEVSLAIRNTFTHFK